MSNHLGKCSERNRSRTVTDDPVRTAEAPASDKKGMQARLGRFTRSIAFVMLTSAVVVVASEKMYWYTGAYTPGAVIELTLYYSAAVMPLLYALGRFAVDTTGRLVLAAGIFAMVTEGIITPVVYSDGPLPVMFLYFLGWHGLMSVVFLWYTVHRWALLGRRRRLALASALVGLMWGVWSTNYWRSQTVAEQAAENLEEPGLWDVGQWAVPKYALFAFGFTAVVIACHWLLGFVWPDDWRPSRVWTVVVAVALVAYLGLWTVAIPWAPVKFAAVVGILVWLLHRSRPQPGSVTLLAENAGRIQLVNLLPLVCMPVAAVAGYALMAGLDLDDAALGLVYWAFVAATVITGVLAAVGAVAAVQPLRWRWYRRRP